MAREGRCCSQWACETSRCWPAGPCSAATSPRMARRSCSAPSAGTASGRRRPRSTGWACARAGGDRRDHGRGQRHAPRQRPVRRQPRLRAPGDEPREARGGPGRWPLMATEAELRALIAAGRLEARNLAGDPRAVLHVSGDNFRAHAAEGRATLAQAAARPGDGHAARRPVPRPAGCPRCRRGRGGEVRYRRTGRKLREEPAMAVLRSYVSGGWVRPADEGRPVLDAVTGTEVARVSSAGVDMAAALEYGRSVGGPALRDLTFHQRAGVLRSLARYLGEHREELYALSARTGATRADAGFDVDGGIGVLFSYASRARRELPNDTVYVEGAVEPLGKGGNFAGQHVLTPLRGVAVQVNAFNFPVWGPLEKFAPAFIAGVPSLVKPATQTAYLTARLVELMAGSGLLPPGTIQLVCGAAGDMLDHLGEQDLVAFTGSAATARRLRAHPGIASRAVRFNAEADSLNCSVLGPDAAPGTPEFGLYVDQLVTEMIVKAGQKCTAIRRALVPAALADAVTEAVRGKLAAVV